MVKLVDSILSFNAGRDAKGLRLKLAKLRLSPFAFLRGTCHRYHEVLAGTVLPDDGPLGWICGDLHLENFGSYRADDGLVHFDINDFDEACLNPLAWDLVRLMSSLQLAGRQARYDDATITALCQHATEIYVRELMLAHPRWLSADTASGPVASLLQQVQQRGPHGLMRRRTHLRHGQRRLKLDGEHLSAATAEQRALVSRLLCKKAVREGSLGDVTLLDVAQRLAGTGSQGLPRFLVLAQHGNDAQEPHLLDLKLAPPCSLPGAQPRWTSQAQRVSTLQARLQAAPAGWLMAVGGARRSWILRRLQPTEDRLPGLTAEIPVSCSMAMVTDLARLTAWAHLRGAGRQGADGLDRICSLATRRGSRWLKDWPRAARAATAWVEQDWRAYAKAYDCGAFAPLLQTG